MSRADLGKDPEEVSSMFDGVAKRYDLVNDLLSLGQTKRWRKKVQTIINPTQGMSILDIAAGPGSSSEPLFKAGADVTSLDFSDGMLEQGRKARPYLKFVKGDAIAGIVIILINILGGLIIGVGQKGLGFAAALKAYTILTIGDGLVAQRVERVAGLAELAHAQLGDQCL